MYWFIIHLFGITRREAARKAVRWKPVIINKEKKYFPFFPKDVRNIKQFPLKLLENLK